MSKKPRITEAEWTVMNIVWKKHPITSGEVVKALKDTTTWSPKTIKTLLTRLVKRGALTYETRGNAFLFSPAVTEEASIERESETFLARFFGGSLNPMIAYFVDKGKLSQEEVEELKGILHRKEEKP
jgi:BlaI family penicillinase repressor